MLLKPKIWIPLCLDVGLNRYAGIASRTHKRLMAADRWLQGGISHAKTSVKSLRDLWLLYLYSSHLIFSVPRVFYNAMIYHGGVYGLKDLAA